MSLFYMSAVLLLALGSAGDNRAPILDAAGKKLVSVFQDAPTLPLPIRVNPSGADALKACNSGTSSEGVKAAGSAALLQCCAYVSETAQESGCYEINCASNICSADSCNCSCKAGHCPEGCERDVTCGACW